MENDTQNVHNRDLNSASRHAPGSRNELASYSPRRMAAWRIFFAVFFGGFLIVPNVALLLFEGMDAPEAWLLGLLSAGLAVLLSKAIQTGFSAARTVWIVALSFALVFIPSAGAHLRINNVYFFVASLSICAVCVVIGDLIGRKFSAKAVGELDRDDRRSSGAKDAGQAQEALHTEGTYSPCCDHSDKNAEDLVARPVGQDRATHEHYPHPACTEALPPSPPTVTNAAGWLFGYGRWFFVGVLFLAPIGFPVLALNVSEHFDAEAVIVMGIILSMTFALLFSVGPNYKKESDAWLNHPAYKLICCGIFVWMLYNNLRSPYPWKIVSFACLVQVLQLLPLYGCAFIVCGIIGVFAGILCRSLRRGMSKLFGIMRAECRQDPTPSPKGKCAANAATEPTGSTMETLSTDGPVADIPISKETLTKNCPFCGEQILAVAIKCKHCGSNLTEEGKGIGERSEVYGIVNLIVPPCAACAALLWFAKMDDAATKIFTLQFLTILFSSIMMALEARSVGAGNAQDLTTKGRRREGPLTWFFCGLLLWFVAFPLWMARRAKYGLQNWCGRAVCSALFSFLVFLYATNGPKTGLSIEDLQSKVQQTIQEKLSGRPELAGLKITAFTLIHKEGNRYEGQGKIEMGGVAENFTVDVTYDGKQLLWNYRPPVREPEPKQSPVTTTPQELSPERISEMLRRSTVRLEYEFEEEDEFLNDFGGGVGSGVIVAHTNGCYVILSNLHVLGLWDMLESDPIGLPEVIKYKLQVKMPDGKAAPVVRVSVNQLLKDLALIIVTADGGDYSAVAFETIPVKQGQRVYAMGHPQGLDYSFTSGVVSAVRRYSSEKNVEYEFIQTDAMINPGNSGGPLVNVYGKLVGLNTAMRDAKQEGLNLAISSKEISSALSSDAWEVFPFDAPASLLPFFDRLLSDGYSRNDDASESGVGSGQRTRR